MRADQSARANRTVAEILRALDATTGRGLVVDSPPGAGKSTLVVKAAGHFAAREIPVMIVAQTNEQVDDLVERLAERHPDVGIGRLHSAQHVMPARTLHDNVTGSEKIDELRELPVIVSTAAKWSFVKCAPWEWAIVDEAYQMRSDALLRVGKLFERALFVGDPGQLDPFSTVETDRWAGLSWDPLRNAVDVTTAHNAGMPVYELPVSWRLPSSAAPMVQKAFYPFNAFDSGTGDGDRKLVVGRGGSRHGDPTDGVLNQAADSGWGYLELPHRETLATDRESVQAIADIAARLLERGATAYSEHAPSGAPVTADRIAIGVARTVQALAIRDALRAKGGDAATIVVDTANKLQGREFDVTIAWHPLAGRADASAFHLETGRLCVLLSRHRHACIVVGRAGIRELLDAHPSTQPVYLEVTPKFPDGWRAHQTVLDHLSRPEHHVKGH